MKTEEWDKDIKKSIERAKADKTETEEVIYRKRPYRG